MNVLAAAVLTSLAATSSNLAEDCTGSQGIDEGTAFLGGLANVPPIPSGGVCWGNTDNPNALAQYDANTNRITLNRDNIQATSPGVDDVEERGGIIAVIVYHELKHVDGSYSSEPCDEVSLQLHTGQQARDLIAFICSANPGANIRALCAFFEGQANCFNNGCAVEGGASTVWETAGCAGSYPGDIPTSSECDNINPDGTCPLL